MKTEMTESPVAWRPVEYKITFETRQELVNFLYAMSVLSDDAHISFDDLDHEVDIPGDGIVTQTEVQVAKTINSLVPAVLWHKLGTCV